MARNTSRVRPFIGGTGAEKPRPAVFRQSAAVVAVTLYCCCRLHCMLHRARCMLHRARCVACDLVHAVRYPLHRRRCAVGCVLPIVCFLLHVVWCLLPVARRTLHVACCILLSYVACCMPYVACCLLHVACCPLLLRAAPMRFGLAPATLSRTSRSSRRATRRNVRGPIYVRPIVCKRSECLRVNICNQKRHARVRRHRARNSRITCSR